MGADLLTYRGRPWRDVTERAAVMAGTDGTEGEEPAAVLPPPVRPESDLDRATPPTGVLDAVAHTRATRARVRQENEQRCAADRELVAALAEAGFTGPRYDRFEAQLAGYALSVLRAWMHTGDIFKHTAARGFHLEPSDDEIEELCRDADARAALAHTTVAEALSRFRRDALVKGAWDPDAGASLATYFLGTCLYVFPNEMRRWRVQCKPKQFEVCADTLRLADLGDRASDPATIVVGNQWVRDRLAGADPRTRHILALTIDGYSQEEIAELLDEDSIRAVEGVVHRWRKKERNELKGGGPGGRP
jgi:DNA-directed RNA polymerase specialized sigma24 family protein